MISTIGKKLVNLQGLPYMLSKILNFGPQTAENGSQPLKFAHRTNSRLTL